MPFLLEGRTTRRSGSVGSVASLSAGQWQLAGIADDAHVYVALLHGKATSTSRSTPETRALRRGGAVAYLVDVRTFAVLGTWALDQPVSGDQLREITGGGEVGFAVS